MGIKEIFKPGTEVKIDRGFNEYAYGKVISYDDKKKNLLGFRGNYLINITGGRDIYGEAKIGGMVAVLAEHVSLK